MPQTMKIITLVFACIVSTSALSQTASPDTTYMLDELVISANKIPELRSRVSQQVQVIPALTIDKLNPPTTADLISNAGTVAVQKSQQGGGSAQIRGFEASRVLLVIDRIRMNNLIYRAGHLQNMITLDANTLERIEILFGPSSTVYGSDALGGVIHFRTKDPELSGDRDRLIKANAFFRYGTVNNEKTAHVDVNAGSKTFASLSSFTLTEFGDLKMGKRMNPALGEPFGLRPFYVARSTDATGDVLISNAEPYLQKFSGYSQYDLLQKFVFKAANNMHHSLNFQFSNSSDVPRYDRLTDKEGSGLRFAEWYYGPQQRLLGAYEFAIDKPWKIADAFRTTLSYQQIEESRHHRRFDDPRRSNQIEDVDVWAVTTDLQRSFGTHDIRFGMDLQFSQVKSKAFEEDIVSGERKPAATRYPDGGSTMHSYALYLTHTFNISEQLTLNDGARFGLSQLDAVFNDKTFFPFPFDGISQNNSYITGNIGAIFKPGAEWKFSFLTSTGYRVPNVDDLAKVFDTNAGESLIVPNPDIKPEKTVNLDLGLARYFSDKIRWENTFFYTFLYDAIVLEAFTFNGQSEIDYEGMPTKVLANQNKRRAYMAGFSSMVRAKLLPCLTTSASFNYTRGRVRNASGSTPLDHIPPAFGRASVSYHKKQLNAHVFVNFNGWKRIKDYLLNSEDNERYAPSQGMPAWYTINMRVGFELNKHFTLQAGVDNLLDLQYRTFSSGINAPGRNIFGTIKVSF